jgi:UDP-N-acetylglucosamine--N-acetylmuramyl-(pentapeptide) pyrophosphoryl-undecaprenol N-acetylglucosamine transferase
MRILITGGGTGGHLMPAIALGEELKRLRSDVDVLFVGTTVGLDEQIFSKSGFPYQLLTVRGFRGHSITARARAFFEVFGAIAQARKILDRFAPQLVVGVGGYASVSASVAALTKRIPLVLMEQNTRPGLANRLLSRFARRICVAFDDTVSYFEAHKVLVTGNPVRFVPCAPVVHKHVDNSLQILVLGGSSGAHRLNIGVLEAFKKLGKSVIKLHVVHQTGPLDEDLVKSGYVGCGVDADVFPFIDEIAPAYAAADLVIARSGAMTVSEIALVARPAVFVPYPFHRDRQQEHNARVIEKLGGAIIINDDESLAHNLANELRRLVADPDRLKQMAMRAHSVAKPDAAKQIALACLDVAKPDNAA